jgi:hypothetical protein
MPARARSEHGMITLWVLGLCVAVLFLGGIGLDFWRAIAVRREISVMADASATAGANGLDEAALRGGRLELDESRVRGLVASELAEFPRSRKLRDANVAVADRRVVVTLSQDVDFSLLGIFMGRGRFTVEARATAEPTEIP